MRHSPGGGVPHSLCQRAGDSDSIDINYASSPFQFLAASKTPLRARLERCHGQRFPRDDSSD